MNQQKVAMRLALDALKDTDAEGRVDPCYAADYLTAALALPDADPVGWANTKDLELMSKNGRGGIVWREKEPGLKQTALYTTPQPATAPEPTDELILSCGPGQEDAAWPFEAQLYFARAVLALK